MFPVTDELARPVVADDKTRPLERETRLELATPTLARLCSTTELFPQLTIDGSPLWWIQSNAACALYENRQEAQGDQSKKTGLLSLLTPDQPPGSRLL